LPGLVALTAAQQAAIRNPPSDSKPAAVVPFEYPDTSTYSNLPTRRPENISGLNQGTASTGAGGYTDTLLLGTVQEDSICKLISLSAAVSRGGYINDSMRAKIEILRGNHTVLTIDVHVMGTQPVIPAANFGHGACANTSVNPEIVLLAGDTVNLLVIHTGTLGASGYNWSAYGALCIVPYR